jgi:hypothetical protein
MAPNYYDETPIEKIVFELTGLEMKEEVLDRVLDAIALCYKSEYDNLDRSWWRYRVTSLRRGYWYFIHRVVDFYCVNEVESKIAMDSFWEIAQNLTNPAVTTPQSYSSDNSKVNIEPSAGKLEKADSLSTSNKVADLKLEVKLYGYLDEKVSIDCYATYANKELTIDFSKIGGSYEDEHYIILKESSLLALCDKLEVANGDIPALLDKLLSTFKGQDCFYQIESYLNQNEIAFSYLLRRG